MEDKIRVLYKEDYELVDFKKEYEYSEFKEELQKVFKIEKTEKIILKIEVIYFDRKSKDLTSVNFKSDFINIFNDVIELRVDFIKGEIKQIICVNNSKENPYKLAKDNLLKVTLQNNGTITLKSDKLLLFDEKNKKVMTKVDIEFQQMEPGQTVEQNIQLYGKNFMKANEVKTLTIELKANKIKVPCYIKLTDE